MNMANIPKNIAHPVAFVSCLCASTKNTIAVIKSRIIAKINATQTEILGKNCTNNIQIILIPTEIPRLINNILIAFRESENKFIPVSEISLFLAD